MLLVIQMLQDFVPLVGKEALRFRAPELRKDSHDESGSYKRVRCVQQRWSAERFEIQDHGQC